jgi:hypothetical protein
MVVAGPVMAWAGSVGDGVLGPFDDETEVYDDRDPVCELIEAMEPTRGEDELEESAWYGSGGRDGTLSLLINDEREAAWKPR